MCKPGRIHAPGDPQSPATSSKHIRRAIVWLTVALAAAGASVAVTLNGSNGSSPGPAKPADLASTNLFSVTIRRPSGPPTIASGRTNFQGEDVYVSCNSCHATTQPALHTRSAADLDQFHQGLKYHHGNLTCVSCHNAGDYEKLRLADGSPLAFADGMDLCSQCHGPQRRDYDRGLHGGMNGYWDLTRGGRIRNTCIDCHDPHSPAFPSVMPVLAPRDRISVEQREHNQHKETPSAHP